MKKLVFSIIVLMASNTATADEVNVMDSCVDKFGVKEGQGIGEAFLKLMLSPVTMTGCVLAASAQVVYHMPEDTREAELAWNSSRTPEENDELAQLRKERGSRYLYGYDGHSDSDQRVSHIHSKFGTTTIVTTKNQSGGYTSYVY